MTGATPPNNKKLNVNKNVIFTSIISAIVIIGSYCLREIYSDNQIIDKLFGGINILISWAIFFTIYHNIEKWIFKTNNQKTLNPSGDKSKKLISFRLITFSLLVIVLFFISLRYLDGLAFLIFWTVLLSLFWAINLYLERKEEKKDAGP